MGNKGSNKEESGYFEPYAAFARVVRTWFIAYGIGAPIFLLSNDTCWEKLSQSGQASSTSWLFLIGVFIQVLTAMLYKTAMWYLYMGERDKGMKEKFIYKASYGFSEIYILEIVFDFGTLILFSIATYKVVNVLLQNPISIS